MKKNIVKLSTKEINAISGGTPLTYAACVAACSIIFGGNARRTCLATCEALR